MHLHAPYVPRALPAAYCFPPMYRTHLLVLDMDIVHSQVDVGRVLLPLVSPPGRHLGHPQRAHFKQRGGCRRRCCCSYTYSEAAAAAGAAGAAGAAAVPAGQRAGQAAACCLGPETASHGPGPAGPVQDTMGWPYAKTGWPPGWNALPMYNNENRRG